MLELLKPGWLSLLLLLPLIWWLHRQGQRTHSTEVSAIFLWQGDNETTAGANRRADPIWLLRTAIAGLLILALGDPVWQAAQAPPLQTLMGAVTKGDISIELEGTCPASLLDAMAAMPAANQSEPKTEHRAIRIDCTGLESFGPGPTLVIAAGNTARSIDMPPRWNTQLPQLRDLYLDSSWISRREIPQSWSAASPLLLSGETPLILWDRNRILVAIDLTNPELTRQSVYPVLIGELIDLLKSFDKSTGLISEARPIHTPLVYYLLFTAGILLLLDAGYSRHSSGRAPGVLALLLLLLAIWDPELGEQPAEIELALVVDRSPSVDREAAALALEDIRRQLKQAGSRVSLSLTSFADTATLEARSLRQDDLGIIELESGTAGAGSNIAAGLDLARSHLSPGGYRAILLVSDGQATAGNLARSIESAKQAAVNVYWLPVNSRPAPIPASILDVQVPTRLSPAQVFPVTSTFVAHRSGVYRSELTVAGESFTSSPVALQAQQVHSERNWIRAPQAGHHVVEVAVRGSGRNNEAIPVFRQGLTVQGKPSTLLIHQGDDTSPLAASFSQVSGPVRVLQPYQLNDNDEPLHNTGLIILDNIAIKDLHHRAWKSLLQQVRGGGSTLLVLGGDNSFFAGGYLGSRLETFLPLVSEPAAAYSAASVVFLLDRSGSMGRFNPAGTALALARQAIEKSAGALRPGDELAIVSFADQARLELEFTAQAVATARLLSAIPDAARGGTDLAGGLQLALNTFRTAKAEQKLLVLITDGFVEQTRLTEIRRELEDAEIQVVALAIGADPSLDALVSLSNFNAGILLRVDEIAELPALAEQQMLNRRAPVREGPVTVQESIPLPLARPVAWPPLDRYAVTRARTGATVYLSSDTGDPLLASIPAGAGRVVALPAGLGAWARHWQEWDQLPGLLETITHSAGYGAANKDRWMTTYADSESINVLLRGGAGCTAQAQLVVKSPLGVSRTQTVPCNPFGACEVMAPAPVPGSYLLTFLCDGSGHQQLVYKREPDEYAPPPAEATQHFLPLAAMLDNWPLQGTSYRSALVISALLAYLAGTLLPGQSASGRTPRIGA